MASDAHDDTPSRDDRLNVPDYVPAFWMNVPYRIGRTPSRRREPDSGHADCYEIHELEDD